MFFVVISIKHFIIITIIILLFLLGILIYQKENKKNKLFITQVMYKLMKEKMENVEYSDNKKLYDISFKNNNRNFFIKIYKGGPKKGLIMTNPTTLYEQTYSSEYGSSKKSEHAVKLTPFLVEPLNGIKIILIKNNMLRITKYINENEIEEVRYNEPSFNTYIVQEKDLDKFLELVKKKKK